MNEMKFFRECLNLDYKGMEDVKEAVHAEDYDMARKAFASYIRSTLEPERFFSVPYEEPENAYLLPGETACQACERIVNDHVMVAVGVPYDFGKEKEPDWSANPTDNQYEEWTWQFNRHPEFKLLAHEYQTTGDLRYAKRAVELFESWYHQASYPGDVSGYDTRCWRTIECGIRMGANWPYMLFALYRTEVFTDQVLTDWYCSVWEHGRRLYKNHTHGNWLIMEMNGLAQIGILYPQLKESETWLSAALNCLENELERQVYPDGFQYELSTIYHEVVVNNYQRVIETAKAFGIPVSKLILKKLENASMIDVKLMMPNRRIPNINDGKWFCSKYLLERKHRILPGIPEFEWILSDGARGEKPSYESLALPYSGFMVMRNGWGQDASWALFDGGPFGRGHQHEDKLSVLIYAGGKVLITEGGNYAYDNSKMREYVLSTRAHNTVMVDGMGQNRRKDYHWGDDDIRKKADLTWSTGTDFDYAESTYGQGYGPEADKSITHNRCIYFVKKAAAGLPPFFITVDRLRSERERSYQVLWHVNSEDPVISSYGVDLRDITIFVSGREPYLEVVRGQKEPEWQGFVSLGQRQGEYEPVNCVRTNIKGMNERIVTILLPKTGDNPVVSAEAGWNVEDDSIILHMADGSKQIFHEREMKGRI